MPSDYQLWEAWRSGDTEAGRELFARHFEAVYRFLFNKLGDAAVDDIVQQTFMACIESNSRFENRSSFRSFILGIANNKLYKHVRTTTRQRIDGPPDSQRYQVSLAEAIAGAREQQLLLKALRALPLELQVLLELSYWEELTNREVADIVQIPVGTLKSRLRKARTQLQVELEHLASSTALRRSTVDNFDKWIASIRAMAARPPSDDPTQAG
jgi:RNA polymerase sigma factor (sigma-70 family)